MKTFCIAIGLALVDASAIAMNDTEVIMKGNNTVMQEVTGGRRLDDKWCYEKGASRPELIDLVEFEINESDSDTWVKHSMMVGVSWIDITKMQ